MSSKPDGRASSQGTEGEPRQAEVPCDEAEGVEQ